MSTPTTMPANTKNSSSTEEEIHMDADLDLELFGFPDDPKITSADLESRFSTTTPLPSATQPSAMDSKGFVDNMNYPSLIGKYAPKNLVKTDKMLGLEAQKREKLARREMALNGWMKSPLGEKLVKTASGPQKRKRPVTPEAEGEAAAKKVRIGGEAGEMGKEKEELAPDMIESGKEALKEGEKKENGAAKLDAKDTAADAAEKKQTLLTPMHSSKQKRKRGANDEDDEQKITKRALTDSTAAEIAQQHQHPSLEDLTKEEKRHDSVTETGGAAATADGVQKKAAKGGEGEQHLARARKSDGGGRKDPNDLTTCPEDDEMTRMLKAELARQCCNVPDDEDSEPEDPRVEQALAQLNNAEKKRVAVEFQKREKKGCRLPDLAGVAAAVRIMIKLREKRTVVEVNRPVKSSPLAGQGVSAEDGNGMKGGDVKGGERKKLKPKGRLGNTTAVATSATPHANDIHATAAKRPSANTSGPTTHTSPSPPVTTTILSPYTIESTDWAAFTLPVLKNNCRDRGLGVTGNKAVLVQRLEEYEKAGREGRTPETGRGKGGKGKGKRRGY